MHVIFDSELLFQDAEYKSVYTTSGRRGLFQGRGYNYSKEILNY